MAQYWSDNLANAAIDAVVAEETFYLAILTTLPSNYQTGAGLVEATGGSYARKAITFETADGRATANTDALAFTTGTDIAAGTYVGYAFYDAATVGNFFHADALRNDGGSPVSRVLVNAGDILNFPVGSLTLELPADTGA